MAVPAPAPILEPLLITAVGTMVGLMTISMDLPLFSTPDAIR